jgi:hypothetical protein
MRWVGHVARILERKNAYTVVGKPEGKRPVELHRSIWEDNIKMYLTRSSEEN